MKLVFSTVPVAAEGCEVLLAKDIKQHDPIVVAFKWAKRTVGRSKVWVAEGFEVRTKDVHTYIKAGANLLHSVDRFFLENKLYGCSPEKLMKALEDSKMKQVIFVGQEQVLVEDIEKIKDQYRPVGFEGVQIGAVDLEDATSTIRGRMMKVLKEDATKAAAVGKWFADGQLVEKVESQTERPVFVPQSEYHL